MPLSLSREPLRLHSTTTGFFETPSLRQGVMDSKQNGVLQPLFLAIKCHFSPTCFMKNDLLACFVYRIIGFLNSLSTFCYLSAQRNALSQLVHGWLATEVRLLGGGSHVAQNDCHHHADNQEDPYTVNGYLQVVWRCWKRFVFYRA